MKYYQVIFIDEYNNFFELGYYKDLADAEPDVNKYLESYRLCDDEEEDSHAGEVPEFGEGKNLDRLVEYPSTFSACFDRLIGVDEGCVEIRGFIKDTEDTIQELRKLTGETNG